MCEIAPKIAFKVFWNVSDGNDAIKDSYNRLLFHVKPMFRKIVTLKL